MMVVYVIGGLASANPDGRWSVTIFIRITLWGFIMMSNPEVRSGNPRILVLASWFPSCASPRAGIFVQQQAAALGRSLDVAVMHVHEGSESSHPIITCESGVTVARGFLGLISNPNSRLDHLRTLFRITIGYRREVLKTYAALRNVWGTPDIVHVHASFPSAIGARILKRKFGIPYVITEHQADYLPESRGFDSEGGRIRPLLVRRAISEAAAVIAVSAHLADALALAGYCESPEVIPNMVMEFDREPHESVRRTDDCPTAIHVSLLRSYEKNIPMLLESLRIVCDRGHDLRFVFVGDGPDRADLEALSRSLGLEKRVEFLGDRDPREIADLYRNSDFSVVSSRYETFCLAAAESISVGCPVVSTRCGGPEEFIDERVGMLVDNDDSGAMATAIIEMMGSYSKYDRARMIEIARGKFSASAVTSQLLDVYRRVLKCNCRVGRADV